MAVLREEPLAVLEENPHLVPLMNYYKERPYVRRVACMVLNAP